MTFPTASLLDAFTRADGTLGANWGGLIYSGPSVHMEIASDQAVSSGATAEFASAVWAASTYSDPCEVWAKCAPGPVGSNPYVMACISSAGTANPTGYKVLALANGSGVQLERQDSGSATTLGTWEPVAPGTVIGVGMSIVDGTLRAYLWDGTSWTFAGSATDSTYTSGSLGLGYDRDDTSAPFVAFGGGTSTDSGDGGGGGGENFPLVTRRGLYVQVCDLLGNPITNGNDRPLPVKTTDEPQVTIPLSDSRTGQVGFSMFEKIARQVAGHAADHVIKVTYFNPKGDSLVLINGIILQPTADFDAETVVANIHDSTIRLKKRFLGYNHYSIMLGYGQTISDGDVDALTGGTFDGISSDYGIPLDGKGLRLMLLDASHGASDWRGWPVSGAFTSVPAMGIRYDPDNSVDDANQQPAYGEDGVPVDGFAFTATAAEGSATLTDVTGLPDGITIADVVEHMALDGPGIADFAVVSSASGTSIVMSAEATSSHTAATYIVEDAIYCQLSRGDNVYDDILDLVQAQGAFECDWLPVDATHLGRSNADWVEGQLCELYTANRVGTDRSKGNPDGNIPVSFVHGLGGVHVVWEPDADSLIDYVVEVGPGGPADPLDIFDKVTVEAGSSIVEKFGIWEDWEQATSAGTGDNPISVGVLSNRAAAVLTAYQEVPDFITVTIDTDTAGGYCFGTDFFVGDTVSVYAKRGFVTLAQDGWRITQVQIAQTDHNGNCQITLTLVPYLTSNANVGAAGDVG